MEAIIIIGHGSRSADAKREFEQVVEMVSKKMTGALVRGAHMELAEPGIPETVENLVKENKEIKVIKFLPYFLYSGIHIKEDIPEIIAELKVEYPNIEFKMGRSIGAEEAMADILVQRSSEI